MLKLFVSQPMRDKTDEQIVRERNFAIAECTKLFGCNIDVIDSYFAGETTQGIPLYFLGESIKLLGTADVVCFCNGWEKYNGCTIEHECAVRYGKKCVYLND